MTSTRRFGAGQMPIFKTRRVSIKTAGKMKKTLFIGLSLVVFLVALFSARFSIAAFLIEQYLKTTSDGLLTYENKSFDKNVITFEKLSLKGVARAEKAVVSYQLDPLHFAVDITILIDTPHIASQPAKIEWDSFYSNFDRKGFLFKTNVQAQILNGDIAWDDEHHAYFSFESSYGQHRQGGSLSLRFSDPSLDANSFIIHLFEQQSTIQIELDCRELIIADAIRLASDLFPPLRELVVSQGIAHGGMKVALQKGGQLRTHGNLAVRDLSFHQKGWNVKGSCQEARLQIDPTFKGKIEFLQPAFLAFEGDAGTDWNMSQLTGGIFFQGHDVIHMAMEGLCTQQNKSLRLQLDGTMSLPAERFPIIALGLKISSAGDDEQSANKATTIAIKSIEEEPRSIEIAMNHVSHDNFTFFQTILGTFRHDWNAIAVRDGYLDAIVHADFSDKVISDLKIKHLHAKALHLDFLPWKMSWKVEDLKGCLSCHLLQDDLFNSLNGDLSIANGELAWMGEENQRTRFKKVETQLSIRQGVIQKSIVEMTFRGLRGRIELAGAMPLMEVDAAFNGSINDIYPFVSEQVRRGLKRELDGYKVAISTHVTKGPDSVEVKGLINLSAGPAVKSDHVEFSFNCASWPELKCTNGWFYAKDLPLEKYISPFIIKEGSGVIAGLGEFKGTFDGRNIVVHYDAQELTLTNKDLAIEVPRVYSEADLSASDPLVAYHRFDLVNHTSEGFLPIHHATYFEKNTGLLFTDIHSKVTIEGLVIHCQELEAFSNGIYLAGESTIDFSSPEPDVFSVDIKMPTFDGKVSQVRHMLSHFPESITISKIPLDGLLSFRGRGGSIHFDFLPVDYTWQGMAEGTILEGSMKAEQVDLSVQDLCLEFNYDHQKNLLAFEDLQGTLLVGKKDRVDEYLLASDKLCFTNFREREVDFDVWIGDKDRDFIRVAGATKNKDSDTVEFLINHHLTHFGQTHPVSVELSLKNWSEVSAFRLQTQIHLSTFLNDLKRFEHTGLFCFSRHLLQHLDQTQNISGEIALNMHYDRDASSLVYQMCGENITFHDTHFDTFSMNGKKQENTWVIDQLQLDDVSLAADLRCHHDAWSIHFLGLRYGKSLLLGLDGHYVEQGDYLDTRVNLLEVDLAELKEWNKFQSFADLFQAEGQLHGTGEMRVKLMSGPPWLQIEADLSANVRSFRLKGLEINPTTNFMCSYSQKKGFSIEDLHAVVGDEGNPSDPIMLTVDAAEITHDPVNSKTVVDKLHFSVPCHLLTSLAHHLTFQFPDYFTSQIEGLISESKKEGVLEGILTLNQQGSYQLLRLELPKGVYSFNQKDYRLSDMKLEKESDEFRFSAKWHDPKAIFCVRGMAKLPGFNIGVLEFIDHPDQMKPLHIDWTYDTDQGVAVKRVSGAFFGLDVALAADEMRQAHFPWLKMHGDVNVDCQRALPLFSEELAQKIMKWQVGSGYLLRGEWLINQDHLSDIVDYLHFRGHLLAKDFVAKGFQFHRMKASVDYSPDTVTVLNLVLDDPAGSLHCPQMLLSKNKLDQWILNAPYIQLENVRPSLLKEVVQKKPDKVKPLVFKDIKLENCQGCLADTSSFRAKGALHFLNPPKKNIKNILFAIPAEILKRIGLDPSVLTPVTGGISLEIKGDRIFLTKMKDVFSEGRASKFYLARRSDPSWIDFDGNLYAQIRMKQYNLLFKLAELFTVTITGNIKKPVYTFQKQPHSSQAPLMAVTSDE